MIDKLCIQNIGTLIDTVSWFIAISLSKIKKNLLAFNKLLQEMWGKISAKKSWKNIKFYAIFSYALVCAMQYCCKRIQIMKIYLWINEYLKLKWNLSKCRFEYDEFIKHLIRPCIRQTHLEIGLLEIWINFIVFWNSSAKVGYKDVKIEKVGIVWHKFRCLFIYR